MFGNAVEHRNSKFKNNHLEQDHRGVKGRTRPMRGFQQLNNAHRFCRAYDEVRNFLRLATRRNPAAPCPLARLGARADGTTKPTQNRCRRKRGPPEPSRGRGGPPSHRRQRR
ncbi:DDE-type integrase/transposase/recombinase [Azospirillum melinis]